MIKKQTKKWTMRNGEKIRICDMDDQHLRNTIAMLERIFFTQKHAIICSGYAAMAGMNGEMAIDSVERGIDEVEATQIEEVFPIYEKLNLELERRYGNERD